MRRSLILLATLASLVACAGTPVLSKSGQGVRIVSNLDKPERCEVVDVLSSRRNQEQGAASGATVDIRNQAATKGANAIRVISASANEYGVVTVSAEALRCGNVSSRP